MKKYIICLLFIFFGINSIFANKPIRYNITNEHLQMEIINDYVVLEITDNKYDDIDNKIYIGIDNVDNTLKIIDDLSNELLSFKEGKTINYKINDNMYSLSMLLNNYGVESYYLYSNGDEYVITKYDLKKLQKRLLKHNMKFNNGGEN